MQNKNNKKFKFVKMLRCIKYKLAQRILILTTAAAAKNIIANYQNGRLFVYLFVVCESVCVCEVNNHLPFPFRPVRLAAQVGQASLPKMRGKNSKRQKRKTRLS